MADLSACSFKTARRAAGFTLIELVVVIVVLAVLAAIAVPRFVGMGTEARLAAIRTMRSVVATAALTARTLCMTDPACDYGSPSRYVTIGGRGTNFNYGWPDAGELGPERIDAWVTTGGFTASRSWPYTIWSLDGAPDPANCWVRYQTALLLGPDTPVEALMSSNTSGC